MIINTLPREEYSMHSELETLFEKSGFNDFKWIEAKEIVVSQWVRFKCMFGCPSYGIIGTCPPNIPPITECREFIYEYKTAVVFHLEKLLNETEDRVAWGKKVSSKLYRLEKEVFLAGYYKAFLANFTSCRLCAECTGFRQDCKNQTHARPVPEALGIDVFTTVRKIGYPINVLKDQQETMNRYAFLLLE